MSLAIPAQVLLVEDDPGMRETLADVLDTVGHRVTLAASGGEGIRRLAEGGFEAAIVDLKLPDMSGIEVLRTGKGVAPDTEVVIITAYASLATAIEAVNGAAFAYVPKPFEVPHLLAVLEKALERRRLLRALRESEARYRLITESVSDGIFLLDGEGRIAFVNSRGAAMTGWAPADLLGRSLRALLEPEGQPPSAALPGGAVGAAAPHREVDALRRDGSRFRAEVTEVGLEGQGGGAGRLVVIRDVTERRRLEEQLRQADKLAALGQLIAGVAHDLNNPLSTIAGNAELLVEDVQDPVLADRARRIGASARRAVEIVRAFLTFARKHEPRQVPVVLEEVLERTLDLLRHQFRLAGVEVQVVHDPGRPVVLADPHQLQQAFLNLLTNAYQAVTGAGRGGVVRVATRAEAGVVDVTVADDGPGIPPEHLPRVFEPFFTTKAPDEGTGMGLPIVRSVVIAHGGTATVANRAGGGAVFVVTLPTHDATPVAPLETVRVLLPRGLQVLVVDDEPPVGELIAGAIRSRGGEASSVASGPEALARLDQSPVDVVVLDLRMPGMSGREVWERLREDHAPLSRRTVFCTGDVVTPETRAFLDATGCPVLTKPFPSLNDLCSTLLAAAAR